MVCGLGPRGSDGSERSPGLQKQADHRWMGVSSCLRALIVSYELDNYLRGRVLHSCLRRTASSSQHCLMNLVAIVVPVAPMSGNGLPQAEASTARVRSILSDTVHW
jgi:hypothetical protein